MKLVNDHGLGIATERGKHASAEVEEEYEGSSWDPDGSEHFEGVHSEDLVCEVCVPNVELTVGTRSKVSDLALVLEGARVEPDIMDGVGRGGGGVVGVGGGHPVPAEEK